jgi:hypothetical protein
MGINGFMKNMRQDNPDIKKRNYESVYIDCNYLLHYFIYNCKNDDDLYQKTYNYLKYLFKTINITHQIHLIFDGMHPHHLQQINPKKQTQEQRTKYKKESADYDKQLIAPKMKIVTTFKTHLIDSINSLKKIYKTQFEIIINDDSVDDEADFKILNGIYESNFKNICIISRDSDMILIAYSLICKKKINIEILSNLRPIMFIDVVELNKGYNLDYVLIILLLGNDYLPKLSNVDYDTIINTYNQYLKHENSPILTNNNINYNNFINYLTYIILNKKIKLNFKNIDCFRFEKYYNNILWCLKKYKVIDNENNYTEDTNNVINIYNFIYSH